MRRSPRKLSASEKSGMRRIYILMGLIALLWLFFAPGRGLFSVFSKRSDLHELQLQTENLRRENEDLRKEIERLENDPAYLEEIARRDYGLLKKHEHVYDFSKPGQNAKEK